GHSAQAEAGDGDAQLAGRKIEIELVFYFQCEAGEDAALGTELEPRLPRTDGREFNRDEISIEQHQPESGQYFPDDVHRWILSSGVLKHTLRCGGNAKG